MKVLNIAAYKFVSLTRLPEMQAAILEALKTRALKGTVLLAEEGINIQMISTSEIKISIVVDAKYTELAVRVLHDAFISPVQ